MRRSMRSLKKWVAALPFAIFLCVLPAGAQKSPPEVAFCDLANNPKAFDGKTIRVRGTLSVYFEDFSLFSKDCTTEQVPWLAFGGDLPGIVTSTVNDNERQAGIDLNFKGVSYGIKKDENFRKLYALIAARRENEPEYSVTATLTGAFFAGEKTTADEFVGGYGHLNCCSLFTITEVADVVSDPPADLTLRGAVSGPDGNPVSGAIVWDDVEGGSPPERQFVTTDANGNFEFTNSGQLLRFEDPRYRPLALAVEPGGAPLHLRIEDAKQSDWIIRSCGETQQPNRRIGFSVLVTVTPGFQFRRFEGDESRHSYFVFRKERPDDPDLIISTRVNAKEDESELGGPGDSEQRWIKTEDGKVVGMDSRFQQGKFYRRALLFSNQDAVAYAVRSGRLAKRLDQILNSACIAK